MAPEIATVEPRAPPMEDHSVMMKEAEKVADFEVAGTIN